MTFTATIEDFSPSDPGLEKLLDGCATIRVEFEARVTPSWDKSVGQGGCDVDDLVIEEVWAEVKCERCGHTGKFDPYWGIGYSEICRACKGVRTQPIDILPRLSPKDLMWLEEQCTEHAAERATEEG